MTEMSSMNWPWLVMIYPVVFRLVGVAQQGSQEEVILPVHAPGTNQMSRMLTFVDGSDEAFLNVYIHRSADKHALEWDTTSVRKVTLGKRFKSPANVKNGKKPMLNSDSRYVEIETEVDKGSRYHWNFDSNKTYDFNNEKLIVGEDGSPYGAVHGNVASFYSEDTPQNQGKAIRLNDHLGEISFNAPYAPAMNWQSLTLQLSLKTPEGASGDIIKSENIDGL